MRGKSLLTVSRPARARAMTGERLTRPASRSLRCCGKMVSDLAKKQPSQLHEFAAQTGEEGFQDVAPKLVINEFAGTPDGNQAGHFQFFHVMRKRWRSDLEASPHGFAGQWLGGAADSLDNLVPTRISQRFRDVLYLILRQSGQFGLLHFFGHQ
jgi:hypothetical protein